MLTMYPVLSKGYSISKVITERGDDMLIYNTTTRIKAYPNAATFEFVKRCRGDKTLEEIIAELSRLSGEPVVAIQKNLSTLITKLKEKEMITFSPSPLNPPRPRPYEASLFRRLPSVIVEITRRCNLHCKHCYNNSGRKREDELTFEEIKKMIDELAGMGVLNIVLTGGEPLLHPHIFDIIEHIRSKPMSCMVFTNGTLITKEIVQKFKELSILSVAASIDSAAPETNDSFRGVPGSFEKTVKAIKMLKKAGISVRVNVCIHKGILNEIVGVLNLFKEWKIDEYTMWPVTYTGRSEESDFTVTPEEYKKVLKQVKAYESKETRKEFSYSPRQTNCGIGMSSLTVRSNGILTPCPSLPDEISLGDIRKNSIAEIWNNSPFLNRMRRISACENDKCKECSHIKVCQGGCMADIYRRTGTLRYGDPYECAYFEVYSDYIPVEVKRQSRLSVEIR